jgi:hypothetical protein
MSAPRTWFCLSTAAGRRYRIVAMHMHMLLFPLFTLTQPVSSPLSAQLTEWLQGASPPSTVQLVTAEWVVSLIQRGGAASPGAVSLAGAHGHPLGRPRGAEGSAADAMPAGENNEEEQEQEPEPEQKQPSIAEYKLDKVFSAANVSS